MEGGNEEADLRGGVKFSFSDFAYYQDQPHKKAFKAIRIGTKARWLFVSAEFCCWTFYDNLLIILLARLSSISVCLGIGWLFPE